MYFEWLGAFVDHCVVIMQCRAARHCRGLGVMFEAMNTGRYCQAAWQDLRCIRPSSCLVAGCTLVMGLCLKLGVWNTLDGPSSVSASSTVSSQMSLMGTWTSLIWQGSVPLLAKVLLSASCFVRVGTGLWRTTSQKSRTRIP